MSEFYEGIEAGVPPVQVWCPRCSRSIYDPAVGPVCAECMFELGWETSGASGTVKKPPLRRADDQAQ